MGEFYTNKRVPFFIHIPRTGGTYVRNIIKNMGGVDMGHCYIIENKPTDTINPVFPANKNIGYHGFFPRAKLEEYVPVVVIRNIFDWWVSFFIFWKQHWTQEEVDKKFEPWLMSIIEKGIIDGRNDPWPSKRRFLFPQIFSDVGNFIPEWICRTETLDDDLIKLAEECGVKKHIPQSPIHISKKRLDYRRYFNNQMVDTINEVFARELDMFGYQFDTIECDPNSILHLHISEDIRNKIKYSTTKDEVYVHESISFP